VPWFLIWIDPLDPWPNHFTKSTTGSGFITMPGPIKAKLKTTFGGGDRARQIRGTLEFPSKLQQQSLGDHL
jgi:hypothetical protein